MDPKGHISMQKVKDAIDFTKINNVLVIKLRHHGDVLLSSPVFQTLKNHHPHLNIDALVYKDTKEMLTLHPAINDVITIDREWKKLGVKGQFREEYNLLKKLKSNKYDLIIHLTEHWRVVLIKRFTGAKYAVAAKYTRRPGLLWKRTFTHHYPVSRHTRHTIYKHLDSLRRVGIQPDKEESQLILVPGEDAEKSRNELLKEKNIQKYILIHPTSRWLFKCWEKRKFSELIDKIDSKYSEYKIVMTAAPDKKEMEMMESILKDTSAKVINIAGKLSLKELAAFIQNASLFVGVDSVPMHMASAFNTPCVAIFGPSNDKEWGPRNSNCRIICKDHFPCRPCSLDGCGGGQICDCITDISVEEVYSACDQLLSDIKT